MNRVLLAAAIWLSALPLRSAGPGPARASEPPPRPWPRPPAERLGAKVWLGRYAEFEEYLRTAPSSAWTRSRSA